MKTESRSWSVADAKARFSELMDKALEEGPQTITRNGRKTVVVVSAEHWNLDNQRNGTLADFFEASPLRGSNLTIERSQEGPRDLDL